MTGSGPIPSTARPDGRDDPTTPAGLVVGRPDLWWVVPTK